MHRVERMRKILLKYGSESITAASKESASRLESPMLISNPRERALDMRSSNMPLLGAGWRRRTDKVG